MKLHQAFATALFYILIIGVFLSSTILCSQVTTTVAQLIPLERTQIIVIDAGHGGEDGGATSCTGYPESALNLQIAQKLDDLFHFLGYGTVMTRSSDTAIYTQGSTLAQKKISDLKKRVRIVNQAKNAVLISIHQNTFSDSQYQGAQVFYAPAGESQVLAETLQRNFIRTLNPGSNRKCKKGSGIYLLEHIQRTGILVECGFLSNPEEEARLRDPTYQNALCCVIAGSTSQFLTLRNQAGILETDKQ